jgi:hypothetical protein
MMRPCFVVLVSILIISLLGRASPAAHDPAKVDSARAAEALRRLRTKQQHQQQEASTRPTTRLATRRATRPAGKYVVFVLDGSGSMKPALQAACDEIYKGVANLPDDTSFNVFVVRDRETRPFSKTPVQPSPTILENLGNTWTESRRPAPAATHCSTPSMVHSGRAPISCGWYRMGTSTTRAAPSNTPARRQLAMAAG